MPGPTIKLAKSKPRGSTCPALHYDNSTSRTERAPRHSRICGGHESHLLLLTDPQVPGHIHAGPQEGAPGTIHRANTLGSFTRNSPYNYYPQSDRMVAEQVPPSAPRPREARLPEIHHDVGTFGFPTQSRTGEIF